MMKLSRKMIISMTTFILLFSIAVVITYAYFQVSEEHGIVIQTGDFEVEMFVYFNDQILTINSPYYDVEKGVVIVNAFDDTTDNFIGNLDIYMSIKPIVTARYRFKIEQEWEIGTYYRNQNEENPIPPVIQSLYHHQTTYPYYPFSNLKFAPEFDQIKIDQAGYVYYNGIIKHSAVSEAFHIIEGGDAYPTRYNDVLYEECYLYFDMQFDVIQANRMEELWGIDQTFFDQ